MDINSVLKTVMILCCCILAGGLKAQDHTSDSLSLAECIQIALKNNYTVQRAGIAASLAETDYLESRQNLIPGISLGVGHNLSQGRSIDLVTNQYINQNFSSGNQYVSGSVTLFRGLEALHRIRQQAAAGKAAGFEEQAAKDQLMLDVVLAYIQVLTARDMLAQNEKRIELTKQQLRRTADLHKNGAIPPSDFYDLEGQLSGDLSALNTVHRMLIEARIELSRLMNIATGEMPPIRSLADDPSVLQQNQKSAPEIFENAAIWIPSLRAAEWRISQAQEGVRVARAGHSPRLTLGGGFQSTFSSNSSEKYFEQTKNNLGRYLSFGLTLPITDHLFVRNNVSRAKLTLRDAEISAGNTRLEWERTIVQVVFNLKLAEDNYRHLTDREESLRESFRIASVRFNAGEINSVLFLTAKNNMELAEADKIIGYYQWRLQQYLSAYFTGDL